MNKNLLIIVTVGFLLYLPSLFGPFLWDDEDFVYANQYVKEFRIDKFFIDSQTAGRGKLSNYYRPIPQIAYATTHSIFGFNPFWFHLLNVLVHIGAACTVLAFFKIFLKTGEDKANSIPFLISLFFLIHPVQTEAVSYISGLSDPLFVLFGFLSLSFFMLRDDRKNMIPLSLFFFALSLLSKETGLVFLPLIFLLNWKKSWPFVIAAGSYLWYHFTFINSFDINSAWGNTPYANSVLTRLSTFIQNIFLYVQLLIFPKELFMERDYSIVIQKNIFNIYSIVFVIINVVLLLVIRKSKILLFYFFAFYISFIPSTGLVLINGIFYEHFLYLPMVFFFAFIIILLPKNKLLLYCFIGLLVLFSVRNIVRQFDWNDSIRFYSQTLERAPKSLRIINGLGMAYAEKGEFDNAIRQYSKIIRLNPNVPNAYHNIANIYAAQGKINEAEQNYLKALEVDPTFLFSRQALDNLLKFSR